MHVRKLVIVLTSIMATVGCLNDDNSDPYEPGSYTKVDTIPILDIHINISTNNTEKIPTHYIKSPNIKDSWPEYEDHVNFNLSFGEIKDNKVTVVGDSWDRSINFVIMLRYNSNDSNYPWLSPIKYTRNFSELRDITIVAAYNTTSQLFHISPEDNYSIENLTDSTYENEVWTTTYEVYDSTNKRSYTIYENMTIRAYSNVDIYLSVPS